MQSQQKGSAIFFSVVALALLFAIGLGITTLLVGELKILRGVGDSVVALNAADAGVERVLYLDIENCPTSADTSQGGAYNECDVLNKPCYPGCVLECVDDPGNTNGACLYEIAPPQHTLADGSSYTVEIIESDSGNPDCPDILNGLVLNYCIESEGSFEEARREIEVKR